MEDRWRAACYTREGEKVDTLRVRDEWNLTQTLSLSQPDLPNQPLVGVIPFRLVHSINSVCVKSFSRVSRKLYWISRWWKTDHGWRMSGRSWVTDDG